MHANSGFNSARRDATRASLGGADPAFLPKYNPALPKRKKKLKHEAKGVESTTYRAMRTMFE